MFISVYPIINTLNVYNEYNILKYSTGLEEGVTLTVIPRMMAGIILYKEGKGVFLDEGVNMNDRFACNIFNQGRPTGSAFSEANLNLLPP